MSKLHEIAKRMGVETRELVIDFGGGAHARRCKPDLEIAHELLAKLPEEFCHKYVLEWRYGDQWYAYFLPHTSNWSFNGTFIEAVIALCERSMR